MAALGLQKNITDRIKAPSGGYLYIGVDNVTLKEMLERIKALEGDSSESSES